MHMFLNIGDLEARCGALKLSARDVARLSGIHWTTWGRAIRGDVELRGSNLRKVLSAIEGEEQRLLAHLIALHPEAARDLVNGSSAVGSHRTEAGGAGDMSAPRSGTDAPHLGGREQVRRPAGETVEGEAA